MSNIFFEHGNEFQKVSFWNQNFFFESRTKSKVFKLLNFNFGPGKKRKYSNLHSTHIYFAILRENVITFDRTKLQYQKPSVNNVIFNKIPVPIDSSLNGIFRSW